MSVASTPMTERPAGSMPSMLQLAWATRRSGTILTVAVAAATGLVAAVATSRGPVSSADVLATIVVSFVVGAVAGLLTGSRWAAIAVPLAAIVSFEVGRLPVEGPTVDAISLGSTYGMIAFAVGRGFHALLAVVPMILGVPWGIEVARRLGRAGTRPIGMPGRVAIGAASAALGVVTVAVAMPGSMTPILGPDGTPLAGSIAELATIRIGGHDQAVMIRGRDTDNPVVLYLAGGPGGTDLGAMRADVTLEQEFVVATWEQRGTGKSYGAIDPVDTLTLEQMVSDTIELTNHLRARFDEERIYLVGNSWGTLLGVLAAERHPELYHAYIGTGQMVSPSETDRIFWADTIDWAEEQGDDRLAAELWANGPPPYADLVRYEPVLAHEHDWNPYPELDVDREMPGNLFVPENGIIDRVNGLRGLVDTFATLYPQIQQIDLRVDAPRLEVPVYLITGVHEARGRAVPAAEWFDLLDAPAKEQLTFEHSGHRPLFEEPGPFAAVMARIRYETYPAGGG